MIHSRGDRFFLMEKQGPGNINSLRGQVFLLNLKSP